MKTIAYQDIAGGRIRGYFVKGETRHERIKNALEDLKPMACIKIYLVKGNKLRLIKVKRY